MQTNYKIGFKNRRQVILFERELKGQISDGHWENSTPRNHWVIPCQAQAFVAKDDTEIGRNFQSRKYNFTNKLLVEVVGSRMISLVKQSIAFPNIPPEDLINEISNLKNWISYTDDYWINKKNKLIQTFGATDFNNLIELLETTLAKINYSEKDLLADLREMKNCWIYNPAI